MARSVTAGLRQWAILSALLTALAAVRAAPGQLAGERPQAPHVLRTQRFLAGRGVIGSHENAAALSSARQQHLALAAERALHPNASLSGAWQSLGPARIASATYGNVTGRVTAVAIDPADSTGNTVYLGTTGGGVWKSTNAGGPSSATSFAPLTDAISAFNPNAGTAAIPSLSIGAVSVANGVVLAGTGDPNDATDSYYGSGLLRSTDGGSTWTLIVASNDSAIAHSFVGLGFAGFAWSSTTPGLVVAAVSEAFEGTITGAVDPARSVLGLYYSNDSGANWQMSTLSDGANRTVQTPQPGSGTGPGNAATAVVWNPVRQQFVAAVRYHGYYASPDGVTWTRLSAQPGAGLTQAACPTNANTSGNPSCPIFRGALAVQPDTGDTFALTVDALDRDQGLWQDACALSGSACGGPVSFSNRLPTGPLEAGSGSTVIPQSDYHLALSAVAINAGSGTPDTVLLVGTDDLYRCTLAAGCALRNTTNAANACGFPAGVTGSQHAIAVLPTAALPLVFVGNDGGVWRSTDGVNQQQPVCSADDATHFQNLNGGLGSLAEVISFAQHPTDAGTLLAGFGANGSAGTGIATGGAAWTQLAPGEGGTVAIDPANPANWYVSTGAFVSIAQCPHGAACTAADVKAAVPIGLAQVSYDFSLPDPPWLVDPLSTDELVIGTCRVWRGPATSPASWNSSNQISPIFSGPSGQACAVDTSGRPVNSLVRSLATGGAASGAAAAQNAGSTVLYAGMAGAAYGGSAGGHLFSTKTGGTARSSSPWTDLAVSPVTGGGSFNPDGFDVSSVFVDAHDPTGQTVYATIMGFNVPHLYRSTNGGAQWMKIDANLPDAPANSVVVDPGDANTVYVATDTGVYVTQQVATCAGANCWSIYGTGLPNAPVVQLLAGSGIAGPGGANGQLRAATYGRGIWTLPLLTAAAHAALAAMALAPSSLTFAAQPVGTSSAAQTITVTNTGNAALTVTSLVITGDFTQTNSCAGATVAVNASCSVQIVFLPGATGARSGLLTLYGNVAGGQATATLSGTATPGAAIVLTPFALSFGSITVGATAAAQNVTISNTGTNPVALTSETVNGDFRIAANTCTGSLPPSSGCTLAIVFSPTGSGARTGVLTVTDAVGTQTAALNGTGSAPATDTLAPLTLSFGPQQINTTSVKQNVTLTNAGDAALTLISGQITSGDFTVTNNCGNSLNGHASCVLAVAYVPKNVGVQTGVLTVRDQFRSQTVLLNGFGLAPPGVSLAPVGPLDFGPLGVGGVSTAQTVTLTNNGGVTLSIASTTVTGDFAIASSTCGSSVAVGTACALQVVFRPAAGGARTGSVTVMDNSPSSPQTLALTGTGVDFALTAGNSTVTVTSGSSAVYSLLLTSAAGVPGTAALTCTGVPINATCLIVPASLPLGAGTVTAVVTVATGVATASAARGPGRVWLALLLPLGAMCLRRPKSLEGLLGLVMLCSLGLIAGCATGRSIPDIPTVAAPSTPTPTPKGTFTLVVSATSSGLTRTQNLTLTVQ